MIYKKAPCPPPQAENLERTNFLKIVVTLV